MIKLRQNFLTVFLVIIGFVVLRTSFLTTFPPGLHQDEESFMYNAYSLIRTGRDEYGIRFPIILRSIGVNKMALLAYLEIIPVFFGGLNPFAGRLLMVIVSTFILFTSFLIIKTLFGYNIAFFSTLFLSISPWFFFYSGIINEALVSLMFFLLGIYFFLNASDKLIHFLLSILFFVLSVYSYHAAQATLPFFLPILYLFYKEKIRKALTKYLISLIFGVLLLIPLLNLYLKPQLIIARPMNISIFSYDAVRARLFSEISSCSLNNLLLVRSFHNKAFYYGIDFLERMAQHLSGDFLFIRGPNQQGYEVFGLGPMPLVIFPFFVFGFSALIFSDNQKNKWLVTIWLFAGLIPSALTFLSPGTQRSLLSIVPYHIIIGFGIYKFLTKLQKQKLIRFKIIFLLIFILILNYLYVFYSYIYLFRVKYPGVWNDNYYQVVDYLNSQKNKYSEIIIVDDGSSPYLHFLFRLKYDPNLYQKQAKLTFNNEGFGRISKLDQYRFQNIDLRNEDKSKNNLYLIKPNNLNLKLIKKVEILKNFYYNNGQLSFLAVKLRP